MLAEGNKLLPFIVHREMTMAAIVTASTEEIARHPSLRTGARSAIGSLEVAPDPAVDLLGCRPGSCATNGRHRRIK